MNVDSRDCNVNVDGVDLVDDVTSVYGTPVYVYSRSVMELRAFEVREALGGLGVEILYSMKANGNPSIVRLFYEWGFGVEVVSPGEAYVALRAGVDPGRIYFTGSSVSLDDLRFIVNRGVNINVDSLQALKNLCTIGYRGEVGLRINPLLGSGYHPYTVTGGLESKFGLLPSEVLEATSIAGSCDITITRLHSHVGSGIHDPGVYIRVLETLSGIAKDLPDVGELDIGGGYAVPYRKGDPRFPWSRFSYMLEEAVEKLGLDGYKLMVEPGRYLVAEAGMLLARVTDVKKRGGKLIVGVDTGMNHLIRPALYDAYHDVVVVNKACMKDEVVVDIVGNICESSDVLAKGRLTPRIEVGDIIALLNAGAYGYSMASNYNMRPLPPEVLLYKGRAELIRKRQTLEDLYSLVVE